MWPRSPRAWPCPLLPAAAAAAVAAAAAAAELPVSPRPATLLRSPPPPGHHIPTPPRPHNFPHLPVCPALLPRSCRVLPCSLAIFFSTTVCSGKKPAKLPGQPWWGAAHEVTHGASMPTSDRAHMFQQAGSSSSGGGSSASSNSRAACPPAWRCLRGRCRGPTACCSRSCASTALQAAGAAGGTALEWSVVGEDGGAAADAERANR